MYFGFQTTALLAMIFIIATFVIFFSNNGEAETDVLNKIQKARKAFSILSTLESLQYFIFKVRIYFFLGRFKKISRNLKLNIRQGQLPNGASLRL